MAYVSQAIGSAFLPKLLGCYEQELHPVIEALLAQRYRRVFNIGCAEGYYAVGFATRLPKAHIHAFDVDPQARQLCAYVAEKNRVTPREHVHEGATPVLLASLLQPGDLVICDCEGCELDLLHPEHLPALAHCDLLLELHDTLRANLSATLLPRFTATHSAQRIQASQRGAATLERILTALPNGGDLDWLHTLPEAEKRAAVDEFRPPRMQWAYLTAMDTAPRKKKAPASRAVSRPVATPTTIGPGITACILARNEAGKIEAALQSLQGWTEQIIVVDNESEDNTADIARQHGALVLTAPRSANFDASRNLAIEHATADWIFYLDADERVPPALGPLLRNLVKERGDSFEALLIPFKNYFCGQWMQHCGWWPGYTRPQLLKKGTFHYGERLHSGVKVDGRTLFFPADDPSLAIPHYSYDSLAHYLTKANHYTDAEAENLYADHASHSWQAQMAHFLQDWLWYYDRHRASLDGMHGFVLAFLAGAYRFLSRAKLWDLRRQKGELGNAESVPSSLREIVDFLARTAQEGPAKWLEERNPPADLAYIPADWLSASPPPLAPKRVSRKRVKSGITACILARNEAGKIEAALQSLQGWTEQIIVIDNESEDDTADIARRYADLVLTYPRTDNFDGGRNLAIEHATTDWIFYLDADERVPPDLGQALQRLVREKGQRFEGLHLPFMNIYYGKWMQSPVWWPGRGGPRLLKKGHFRFSPIVHGGAQVEGRVLHLPADGQDMAIHHYAYDTIHHYLTKLNQYTDAEARSLVDAGESHSWQTLLAAFVREWHIHYDQLQAHQDGMHGFVQAFLCAFYRFACVAKAWDLRRQQGERPLPEPLPASTREMLAFMAHVLNQLAPPAEEPSQPLRTSGRQRDAILVQCASGDHIPLLEMTRARHEEYAHAHGMDYLCRYGPQQTGRSPMWDKIPLLIEVLRNSSHSYVFWLDADTLLVDRTRDLRDALPADCWLGMVQHGNPPYFNNGAMYLRNTPQALAFLEAVWATWPVHSGWEDNAAVLRVLQATPEKWRGVQVIADTWNSTVEQNESPHPVVKAWHGYASARERMAAMSHALQEAVLRERSPASASAPVSAGLPAVPVRPPANPVPLDAVPPVDFRTALNRPLRIRWEGDQTLLSSLALVNRELGLELLAAGDVELSLAESRPPWRPLDAEADPRFPDLFARLAAPLSGPPDVTIRHHFPPNWSRPDAGKLIVIQPWELSHLPRRSWVDGARHHADEVWVPSRWVRDAYVRSGVPAEKVIVVPNGVRPDVFTPDGPPLDLPTQKRFRFLFVGGTIARKGPDLLLDAYLRAFTRQDDVCLVVKDMGTRTFYQPNNYGEVFRRVQADPQAPEIVYLEEDLSEAQLAALYRACSCVVLPYRGEGFGLPPLEGMACGLPAIVTSGGATDDYLDDHLALRVPHYRVARKGLFTDPDALAVDPWELEPDRKALQDALRWAYEHPQEMQERGQAARAHVATGWTWTQAAGKVRHRLHELVCPPTRRAPAAALPWKEMPPSGRHGGKKPKAAKPIELSLCMITRNEEPRIQHCLESIAPFVDEMIMVDTGSTDRTREIAHACGARVFDFPWTDSFSEARNQSLQQARGKWIFWMDADDVISPECGAQLRELARRHPDTNAAYTVQVRIPPGPNEFSPSVVDHIKLFPNRPDVRFTFRIHEQVLPSLRQAGVTIHTSDLFVTHQHYDRSPEGQDRKRQRDFRLLELDLREQPNHPFVLFNLGMTHLYATKEYEVAAQYLRRCLASSHWQDSIVRKAYALLVTARLCQLDLQAALAVNEEGRGYYPEDAELLFQAGQIYAQLGRMEDAYRALERLIGGGEEPRYRSVDVGLRTYRGWHEMALLHRQQGNIAQCVAMLRHVTRAMPTYLPAWHDLEQTLRAHGKADEEEYTASHVEQAAEGPRLSLLPWPLWSRIQRAHQTYDSQMTMPGMAISLDLAVYLWSLLEERKPNRILDLGSGFSSWIFRLYAQTASPPVTVWTVDDDPIWMRKSQEFLMAHNLPIEHMCVWSDFPPQEKDFDLILHDLGNFETRAATLERVLALASPEGIVVLDDMQNAEYAAHALEVVRRLKWNYQDLKAVTRDHFGRFSGLANPGLLPSNSI